MVLGKCLVLMVILQTTHLYCIGTTTTCSAYSYSESPLTEVPLYLILTNKTFAPCGMQTENMRSSTLHNLTLPSFYDIH